MKRTVATLPLALATVLVLSGPGLAARANETDGQVAKAGIFQKADFPAGWRATPHKKSKTNLNDCPALKKSLGKTRKTKTEPPRVL